MKQSDLTGNKYGRLSAIKFVERKGTSYKWLFKCDCGLSVIVNKYIVLSGKSSSCGCLQKNTAHDLCIKRNTSHGMSKNRFYKIWKGIKKRCNNSNCNRFSDYGGRGIHCEWISFESFLKDMNRSYKNHIKKYGERQTILDRIDTNGNYSKENCRWVTYSKNCRNKRNNVILEFQGKSMTLVEWSELLGINYGTIRSRIRYGFPINKILSTEKL